MYELDLDLEYGGTMEITIVAVMGSGGGKMKLPITLNDVKVTAPLRFVIEFFPENPFVKILDVSFRVVPPGWLSFNIKIMGALNVLSLPGIKAWVRHTQKKRRFFCDLFFFEFFF